VWLVFDAEVWVAEVRVLLAVVVPVDTVDVWLLVTVMEVGVVKVRLPVVADRDVEEMLAEVLVDEVVDVSVLMVRVLKVAVEEV
jgi:hypothetical protein